MKISKKLSNITRLIASIGFLVLGTLLLIGELEHFDVLLFVVVKAVGFICLAIALLFYPYTIPMSLDQEERAEFAMTSVIIVIIVFFCVYLAM